MGGQDNRQAWWRVTWFETERITSVRITNRGDCCSGRLADFSVLVGGQLCAHNSAEVGPAERVEIPCVAQGVDLTIRLSKAGVPLTLCEVEVFVEPSPHQEIDQLTSALETSDVDLWKATQQLGSVLESRIKILESAQQMHSVLESAMQINSSRRNATRFAAARADAEGLVRLNREMKSRLERIGDESWAPTLPTAAPSVMSTGTGSPKTERESPPASHGAGFRGRAEAVSPEVEQAWIDLAGFTIVQSSTKGNLGNFGAPRAVDGIFDPDLEDQNSCTHTDKEPSPWWSVESHSMA